MPKVYWMLSTPLININLIAKLNLCKMFEALSLQLIVTWWCEQRFYRASTLSYWADPSVAWANALLIFVLDSKGICYAPDWTQYLTMQLIKQSLICRICACISRRNNCRQQSWISKKMRTQSQRCFWVSMICNSNLLTS